MTSGESKHMAERTVVHETIVTERTYDHPPDRVFAKWRDPAIKREWFAEGAGWRVEEYGLDFRVGGREHGRFHLGNGPEIRNETVYLDIVPDRRIVMAYTMAVGGRNISASLGTVEFEAAGAGTRLIYTEQGAFFDPADGASSREQGWRGLLESLAATLARKAPARTD
jgi:uncharacterized protein YndB with AHSA1/START domain